MRATALTHHGPEPLPVIRATIVAGENDVGIRISDEGMLALLMITHVAQRVTCRRGAPYTPESNSYTF